MIERKFVKEKVREFQVKEYIDSLMPGAGHSDTQIKRTPLGDRVIITAAKPGLVVGRKGENIRAITLTLKKKFELENPQVEIEELQNPFLDASFVAERIARSLERLGIVRFKSIAHRMLEDVMHAGALGIEIHFSGKIPSARARTWRFWQGYMKKSGSVSQRDVDKCIRTANLKSGAVGVVVMILPPTVSLPDDIKFIDEGGKSIREKHIEELKVVGGGRIEDEEGLIDLPSEEGEGAVEVTEVLSGAEEISAVNPLVAETAATTENEENKENQEPIVEKKGRSSKTKQSGGQA